jgi:hypothetical protein
MIYSDMMFVLFHEMRPFNSNVIRDAHKKWSQESFTAADCIEYVWTFAAVILKRKNYNVLGLCLLEKKKNMEKKNMEIIWEVITLSPFPAGCGDQSCMK